MTQTIYKKSELNTKFTNRDKISLVYKRKKENQIFACKVSEIDERYRY